MQIWQLTLITRIGVFAQGQILCISPNGLQAGHCDAPAPFWMTENHLRSHFSPFQINAQLHFFLQNDCRRPYWLTENHFRSHFSQFQINTQLLFVSQNGCRRPFWMTENHFRSHFSPFQINTQLLFCLQNGCRRPFWMTEHHFRSHFSPFQINTQHEHLYTKWPPEAILFFRLMPKIIRFL